MAPKPTREDRESALRRSFGEDIGVIVRLVSDIGESQPTYAEQARIYWLFNGLGSQEPMTDQQIGDMLGMSKSNVKRIRGKFELYLKGILEQRRLR